MTKYVRDDIRKQGWWIWANYPWQRYHVTPEGFQITNGAFTFNRVLHGPPGPCEVLAGDRPQVKLAQATSRQYGNLSLGVVVGEQAKWCHAFDHIVATYDPGRMLYELTDAAFPTLTVRAEVLPLSDAPGFVLKVTASHPVDLLWSYGGLKCEERSVLAQDPMPGGIRVEDLAGDQIELGADCVRITHPDLSLWACVGTRPSSTVHLGDASVGTEPQAVMGGKPNQAPLAFGRVRSDGEPVYIVACLADDAAGFWPLRRLLIFADETYDAALGRCQEVQRHLVTKTPDLLFDQAAKGIASSLDGCWLPPGFLHGAVRWGIEAEGWLVGWRGWYGPIALGWYERVARAARLHARYQVQEQQTAHSGPGRICASVGFDGRLDYSEEYNMGEVYLDQLYHYYCWTGDRDLLRELYPTIRDFVAWERRTLDPDGDGLYENHMNTWISDGHWYSGGPGAQASAYMVRANLLAAEAAELVGDDPEPYRAHARQIREAMNSDLWLDDRGHYAEYREFLPPHRLHDAAELATIYHPIDSGVPDVFQTYQCLRYVENRLWLAHDLLLSNDWYPVIVTNGTIATAEILHTALCYYRLGDADRAWRLMRGTLDTFVKARVPGTITEYAGEDGHQGTYADFTDSSSMYARAVVEGTFGIIPRRQDGVVTLQPGFPPEWPHASIELRDIAYTYQRDGLRDTYAIRTTDATRKILRLVAREDEIEVVSIDGEPGAWAVEPGVGRAFVVIDTPPGEAVEVTIAYHERSHEVSYNAVVVQGDPAEVRVTGCTVEAMHDPQGVLADSQWSAGRVTGQVVAEHGPHTFFVKLSHGNTVSWEPIDIEVRPPLQVIQPKMLVPQSDPAGVHYTFAVRNNRAQTQHVRLNAAVLGQVDTTTVTLEPYGEAALSFVVNDPQNLTPGVTPLAVHVSGDWEGRLAGELRLWKLFDGLEHQSTFQAQCVPVALPFNDRLEDVFTHAYSAPRAPGWALQIDEHALNAWTGTWYRPECINADHVRANLDENGVFVTDVGVPFRQVRAGANGLFVARWDRFPEQVTIPIGRTAKEMYLLLAGSSLNNQTYIANGRIVVTYADGEEQVTELYNPTNYDHLLQHFSENYPQWIGGKQDGYYIVGGAEGSHADILNVPLSGQEVREVTISCISHEIIIGLLGLTLVV